MRFIDPDGMAPVTIHQGTASHSDSEDPNQNEVATGQVGTNRDFLWSDGYGKRSASKSTISIGSFSGAYLNSRWTPEQYYRALDGVLLPNG